MELFSATSLNQEEADVDVRPMEACSLLLAGVTAHSAALYDGCYPLCQHRTGQSWFPLGAASYLPPFFFSVCSSQMPRFSFLFSLRASDTSYGFFSY